MTESHENIAAVIMAGGIGTRFWPISTEEKPKQFCNLFDDRTLLQKSFDRLAQTIPPDRILVLTNERYVGVVKQQLSDIPLQNIIGEPLRRNTAAAVCLGAQLLQKRFGNPVIITVTADHLIEPHDVFIKTMLSAASRACDTDLLYTFAIKPTYPATGYGYIEIGNKVADDNGIHHYNVLSFKEKPDTHTAGRYINTGRHFWNSGMFVWSSRAILKAIETYLPQHRTSIAKAVEYDRTPQWQPMLTQAFESLQPISIDYAVIEKSQNVRCVTCDFSWKDVGGWQALGEFLTADRNGNQYSGNVYISDSKNSIIYCEDKSEILVLAGVEDMIVVRAGDKTLIMHKEYAEKIKHIIESIEEGNTQI